MKDVIAFSCILLAAFALVQCNPLKKITINVSPHKTVHISSHHPTAKSGKFAIVKLVPVKGTGAPLVTGTLYLAELNAGVQISGTIFGLKPGKHGWHVHRDGSTADECDAAGPHFNPKNVSFLNIF